MYREVIKWVSKKEEAIQKYLNTKITSNAEWNTKDIKRYSYKYKFGFH